MLLFQEKAQEDVSKHLVSITTLLFGADSEQQSDIALAQLSQEMYNSGLLLLLLKNLHKIDFEVRDWLRKFDVTDYHELCFRGRKMQLKFSTTF